MCNEIFFKAKKGSKYENIVVNQSLVDYPIPLLNN